MEDYRLEQSGQEVQNILNGAAMQSDLTAETDRATEAEQTLQGNIDIEERDRKAADLTLQGNIDAEELRAKAAEKQNADDIDALEEKVPSGASSSNKLATEEYVDDSVATATATFRGTYNLVSDLHLTVDATWQQIATELALAISTADNNDYCFVQVPTSSETPTEIQEIDRYKFNGTAWGFEYKLNNSGFTAAQWAAINSGITSGDVSKLAALPTNSQLTTLLDGKQDVLTFDNVPTEGSSRPVKSGGVYSAIDDEKTARETADSSLSSAIEAILLLIPSAATSLNKLADKAFVNSSIATASATFRGTYNLVTDLSLTVSATHAQIATALAGAVSDEDNNDYACVQIPTSDATPTQIAKTERYKYNGTTWEYEYTLNNSGFTSAQWTAINSGITSVLVSKLSELPTNSELTTDLGTLTSAITAINQKIPSAAAQNNKLVDTAALESYIVQVLGVLTVSYNITSTDGHVTLAIQQTDGKITSVSLTTSDIASAAALNLKASQADLTALASRVTTAEGNITTLGGRVSTNETDIAQLQAAYEALTQSDIIIGALPASGVANKIYRVPGTSSYSDYMWNGTQFVLMATYNNAIDPRPKKGSTNLVESGGVFDNMGALDISELNATENPHTLATYADLSAALAAIPSNDYKKGGMSIKFVQTDDNKYVQYRLMATSFSTTESDWWGLNSISDRNGSITLLDITHAILNTNGEVVSSENKNFYVATYQLSNKIYSLLVTGGSGLGVSLMAEFDENDNCVSVDKANINGGLFNAEPIKLNDNTVKVKVFGRSDRENALPYIEVDSAAYSKSAINSFLGVSNAEKYIYTSTTNGIVASNGYYNTGGSNKSFVFDLAQYTNPSSLYLKANANDNSYFSLLMMSPINTELCSFAEINYRHTVQPGEDVTFSIPKGTRYIYVDARDATVPEEVYIIADAININSRLENIENNIVLLQRQSISPYSILSYTGDVTTTDNNLFYVASYNVSANSLYYINGSSGQYAALAGEYDKNGNILKVHEARTANTAYNNYPLVTSSETVTLKVFGRLNTCMPVVAVKQDTMRGELETLIRNNRKEISILFIGNSLTQDAVSCLPLLMKEILPNVSFKFYVWYNGGKTLYQQYNDYFLQDYGCEIFSICDNGVSWNNMDSRVKMSTILSTYTFDIVCLQEYFNYKETYTETDLADYNNCVSYIQEHYNKSLKFVSLLHAPLRSAAESVYNLTVQGNELILAKTVAENIIPAGTAIYKAMSTELDQLGDLGHLSPDGTHAQEGLPCLLQSYVVFMWICDLLGVPCSIVNSQTRITQAVYNLLNVMGPNLGTGVIEGTDAQNKLAQKIAVLSYKSGLDMQNISFHNS